MPTDLLSQPRDLLAGSAVTPAATVADPMTDLPAVARQSGFMRGLLDTWEGGRQMLMRTLEATAAGDKMKAGMTEQRQLSDEAITASNKEYRASRPDPNAMDWARLGGNIVGSAPLAAVSPPGIGGGIVAGAASGMLQPVDPANESYWTEKAKQGGIGGLAGGATAGFFSAISRALAPKTSPSMQLLRDEGVSPTIGQVLGGNARAGEEIAKSVPVVGQAISGAERRAVEDFNRAAINRALKPIGQSLPRNAPVGHDAVADMAGKIGAAYDALLPKLKVGVDKKFGTDVVGLKALADNLPDEQANQFGRILGKEVLDKFSNGQMSGETMKAVESELGRLTRAYEGSSIGAEKELGRALMQLQANVRSLVERGNPQYAKELKNINLAFANSLRVEKAASAAARQDGVFTPFQLSQAARQMDSTVRRSGFSRGNALMQDLSRAGMQVLSPNVPDSGTAGRVLPWLALGSGFFDPTTAAVGLGASLPYTQTGQRLAASLFAGQRPPAFGPMADFMGAVGPGAATAMPPLYNNLK